MRKIQRRKPDAAYCRCFGADLRLRFAGGADPVGGGAGEADVGEAGGGEHGGDLGLGETVFEAGAEAVEGVGAHGVEGAVGVEPEGPGIGDGDIFSEAGERPVDCGGDDLRNDVAKGERQTADGAAGPIRDFPERAKPSGAIVESIVEIKKQSAAGSEFADERLNGSGGVGQVVQDAKRKDEIKVGIGKRKRIGSGFDEGDIGSGDVAASDLQGERAGVGSDEMADERSDESSPAATATTHVQGSLRPGGEID